MLRCIEAGGGILFPIILLSVSGCLTLEDGTATPAVTNSWERAPQRARVDDGKSRKGAAPMAASADTPVGETTYLEGTGRFVGEQRPRARSFAPEVNEDPVTLKLVNVPAPQAAKTVLGDMFGIKYTVDPDAQPSLAIDDHRAVPGGAAGE